VQPQRQTPPQRQPWPQQSAQQPSQPQTSTITVLVNGDYVQLSGKESYIFVDVFDYITFDLNAGNGRAIITKINGSDAGFIQPIYNGDKIEIYWKDKK
jgi:hypothetical protein